MLQRMLWARCYASPLPGAIPLRLGDKVASQMISDGATYIFAELAELHLWAEGLRFSVTYLKLGLTRSTLAVR